MIRLMLLFALPLAAAAQNHEIGLTLGRIDGPSRTTAAGPAEFGAGIALQANYGYRFWLSKKVSRRRALRYTIDRPKGRPPEVGYEVFEPKLDSEVPRGTVSRAKAVCPACRIVVGPERVRAQLSAQRGGGVFGKVPYSSAKAAILGFTKSLARELEDSGVTVNAVTPGAVDTSIRVGSTDEQEAAIRAGVPLGRTATTREVASVITFLSSDDAAYLTGTTIDINGGSHMH